LEETTEILPVKGALLIRFDGITGIITDTLFGTDMYVAWDNGNNRVYSVKYGAIA
jgi:hypothetical protein